MEEANDYDENDGVEVQNAKDIMMLERMRLGIEDEGENEVEDEDEALEFDNIDSDDDTQVPRGPPATLDRGDNF